MPEYDPGWVPHRGITMIKQQKWATASQINRFVSLCNSVYNLDYG